MKKKITRLFILIYIISASIIFSSCINENGTAKVTIDLGFAHQNAELNKSFIDKLLGLFETKAFAAAPDGIETITINVTGPGMDDINMVIPIGLAGISAPSDILIEVPSGNDRVFTVTANMNPLLIKTAATEFQGTKTTDLESGSVTIEIKMIASETKILIPDEGRYIGSQRIVQIDDMSGTGWTAKRASDLNLSSLSPSISTLYPYDIDFDSQGRIYVVHYSGSGDSSIVILDNINDTSPDSIATVINIKSIAIDRVNDIIYYADANTIYVRTIAGVTSANITGFTNIYGLAVDNNGMLYISHNTSISKYNPFKNIQVGETVELTYDARDVVVKGNSVYVALNDDCIEPSENKIVQLSLDLVMTASFGSGTVSDIPDPGRFLGPMRFVAILNKKLYIIDEMDTFTCNSQPNIDRLIAMDNITGANWETFGSTGTGTNQFYFYIGS